MPLLTAARFSLCEKRFAPFGLASVSRSVLMAGFLVAVELSSHTCATKTKSPGLIRVAQSASAPDLDVRCTNTNAKRLSLNRNPNKINSRKTVSFNEIRA